MRVKGFQIFKDRHDKARCYHRTSRVSVDLDKHPLGSAEFIAECGRIAGLNKAMSAKPGALGLLIREWQRSPSWQELQPGTQQWYNKALRYLEPIYDTPLVKFDRPLVVRIRDKAHEKKSWYFANQVKNTLSTVFSWGSERGYLSENPADGIKKIQRPKDLPRANRPWTDSERFVVLDRAASHVKKPLALMMYIGMDTCDALKFMKNRFDGVAIKYERQKTGVSTWQPAPQELVRILKEPPKHDAVTVCANSYGKPWTVDGFNTIWMRFRNSLEERGLIGKGLTLKGLRHTKGTILREMGEDSRTVAESLGQKTEAMGHWYSRDADESENMSRVAKSFDAEERKRIRNFVKPSKKVSNP